MKNTDFHIGARVGFTVDYLEAVDYGQAARQTGVVIGHTGDKFVRVKFDDETERVIPATNLRVVRR